PARAHVVHGTNAFHMRGSMLDLRENFGLDAVNQSGAHRQRGILHDEQDRDRNGDANDGIENRNSRPDASYTYQHCETGETIHSSVLAVRHHGSRTDLSADSNAEHRYRFIAEKSDDGRECNPPELCDWLWINHFADRFVAGDARGTENDQDDDDA